MHQRGVIVLEHKRAYLGMLALAVAVRGLAATGVDALAQRRLLETFDGARFGAVTMALATGTELPPQETEQRVWVLHKLPAAEKEAPPAIAPFTAEEAAEIGGNSGYTADAKALLLAPLKFSIPENEPAVLIVHTHTSEAYTQSAGYTYDESDSMRTTDQSQSVVRVGDVIAQRLSERGIETLHDTSFHDYPAYNGAYARSLEAVQAQLEKTPSVQVVLDIHRDANEHPKTVSVGGETAAQLMFVVGTDAGGLSHPDWRDNLSFALKLHAAAERRAPGICKAIDLRKERFNQHVRPGALIIEIGATGNTLPEALTAANVLADALCDVLISQRVSRGVPG